MGVFYVDEIDTFTKDLYIKKIFLIFSCTRVKLKEIFFKRVIFIYTAKKLFNLLIRSFNENLYSVSVPPYDPTPKVMTLTLMDNF